MTPYGIVYCALAPNGKRYIGQTTQSLVQRHNQHYSDAKRGGGCPAFSRALNKYGVQVVWETLAWCDTKAQLDFTEAYYITKYETMNKRKGYNLKEGGANGKPGEEARANISKGKKGKKLSAEHRANISKGGKGKKRTAEQRANISKAQKGKKGKKQSAERIANRVAKNTGKKRTAEQRANISKGKTGKTLSSETRRKISEAQKGKKRTPEHIANIVKGKQAAKARRESQDA